MQHIEEIIKKVIAPTNHIRPEQAVQMTMEQVESLSPQQQLHWARAFKDYKPESTSAGQGQSSQEKTFKCPYCLDTTYISIKPMWEVVKGSIEKITWDDARECLNHNDQTTWRIPCDCHLGHIGGNEKDPAKMPAINVKRYTERVGEPVAYRLGRMFLELRKQREAEKGEKVTINEALKGDQYF